MNFFKTFLAALLAFIVANVFWFFLGILIVVGIVGSMESGVRIKPGSILRIDLAENIVDSPSNDPFEGFDPYSMRFSTRRTLFQAIGAIEAAASDERIEGIYINLGANLADVTTLEELRAEIERFKSSGKFVVGYGEFFTQGDYYLASVADELYLHPEGELTWQGVALQVMFFKGLLDKLDIEPEVFRHGTFKSAVEPFITDRMSPENRLQMETIAHSIWGTMVSDVAASRNLSIDDLNRYATGLEVSMPEGALQRGMVDSLLYEDQVRALLAQKASGYSGDEPEYISLGDYISQLQPNVKNISSNRVALIYAEGQIVSGQSAQGAIGSQTLAEQLAEARRDERVKAVVLRVNSPGGSALASDVIWREMTLLKEQKPVIVSMGAYAASGGYYISCPADAILSDRMTLTGSIGVFGLAVNLEKTLRDKVGITVEAAKSNPSADLGSLFRPVTQLERARIMRSIEKVYSTFVDHVARGRNLSVEEVDAIGGGRVWTGADAKRIGLVDEYGGLKEAIAVAADKAGLGTDFRVYQQKQSSGGLAAILSGVTTRIAESGMRNELGEAFVHYRALRALMEEQGVQAYCPYRVEFAR